MPTLTMGGSGSYWSYASTDEDYVGVYSSTCLDGVCPVDIGCAGYGYVNYTGDAFYIFNTLSLDNYNDVNGNLFYHLYTGVTSGCNTDVGSPTYNFNYTGWIGNLGITGDFYSFPSSGTNFSVYVNPATSTTETNTTFTADNGDYINIKYNSNSYDYTVVVSCSNQGNAEAFGAMTWAGAYANLSTNFGGIDIPSEIGTMIFIGAMYGYFA